MCTRAWLLYLCVHGRSWYWQMACSPWTERSCLIKRGRELALSRVALPPFDREVYLLGHGLLPGSVHCPSNRCLLYFCTAFLAKICPWFFLCLVFILPPDPPPPNSSVTGGRWLPSPSFLFLCLSFAVCCQTDSLPRCSPWISCSGVWSGSSWPLQIVWIFQPSETLWRAGMFTLGAVDVGHRHGHAHTSRLYAVPIQQANWIIWSK